MILEEKDLKNIKDATKSLKKVLKTMTDICNKRTLCFNWKFDDVCPFYFYNEGNKCKIDFVENVLNTINVALEDYK